MNNNSNILRDIPQVERLLQDERIKSYIPLIGRGIVLSVIRDEILSFRNNARDEESIPDINDLMFSILRQCGIKRLERLQRVINGTGVIIHTNLGRSPLPGDILKGLVEMASGYCNVELHIPTGKRGKRGGLAEELICSLTSAEDALIVNNNASAVFLILSQFASGREVIVSRSELIQIGGGFRIPDIMRQTGVKLVEVGTTNITEISDIKKAVTDNTAMIFSAHQSNYKIEGFTKMPELREMASLKSKDIIFVRDLGSGNLVNHEDLPRPFEPTIISELAQGPDILCFSGDKLLGGCQAGIIIGEKEYIGKLRKNPLMRMIRVDKITYYILQETLINYSNGALEKNLLWNIIFQDKKTINKRINRLLLKIKEWKKYVQKIPLKSTFGGGSMPGIEMDSLGIQLDVPGLKGGEIYDRLIAMEVPIAGYIFKDRYTLDFRTVFDRDINDLAKALGRLFKAG